VEDQLRRKSSGSIIQRKIILAVSGGAGFIRFNESNLNGAVYRAVFEDKENI
jgi:hypothetical protein